MDDQLCLFTLLYAPREQHEHIIGELVTPIAQAIRDAPELDSLFFARYNVPSWQLRFGILGRPGWISGPVLERVREGVKPLQEAGAIEAVELAEYDRELERYGGEKGMALAEKLFLHDSLAILERIAADRQGLLEKSRREISLLMTERLLDLLAFDRAQRIAFYEYGHRWTREMDAWTADSFDPIEQRFLELRPGLQDLFTGERRADPAWLWGGRRWRRDLRPLARREPAGSRGDRRDACRRRHPSGPRSTRLVVRPHELQPLRHRPHAGGDPALLHAQALPGRWRGRRALVTGTPATGARLALLRVTALPFETLAPLAALIGHLAGRAELEAHRAHYTDAYDKDLRRAHRALLALSAQDTFQEGLRPVGRSLLERWQRLAAAHPDRLRHDERHTLAKITAYAARFATKSSPNSVFCATALASIRGVEARADGANRQQRVDVILSIAEARKIAAWIGADRAAWPGIVPRPNPTLACAEGVWSFWRPSTLRRDDNDEVLCRTRAQPILDLFLAEAAGATRRVPELLAAVSRRAEIELDELTPFFDQLVAGGLLIAEFEPPYSCRRPLRFIAERMREADATAPWLAEIEAVEEEVDTLPRLAPGERMAAMDRLEERLFAFPGRRAEPR